MERGAHKVLDVGCGEGVLGAWLLDQGYARQVDGVDFHEPSVVVARKRLHRVFLCDLNKLDKSELYELMHYSEYDYIVCADILEHLVDPWGWVRFFSERLSAGGRFIVSIPNVCSYKIMLPLLLRDRFDYKDRGLLDRTHLRFLTRRTAMEMLEQCGLKVVAVRPLVGSRVLRFPLSHRFIAHQWLLVAQKPIPS